MSASPLLLASDVRRRFGEQLALDGLSLRLEAGELVGFVGPNGAGKSTLLRILIGIHRRDSGSVEIVGRDPNQAAPAIRKQVSYLPGETNVYDGMTGRDYLEFATSFHKRLNSAPDGEIARAFDVPLGQRIRGYSAGMKQKLAIRAALSPDVPLYLLDEPDRALDASVRLALRDWLRALRDAGKGVLLSSHHLAEVEALADRCAFVFAGRDIPPERVADARAQLRREIRVRLTKEVQLPSGATVQERLPDGSIRVRVEDATEPLQWLAQLPGPAVLAAEVGATRLEDVYRVLQEDEARNLELAATEPAR